MSCDPHHFFSLSQRTLISNLTTFLYQICITMLNNVFMWILDLHSHKRIKIGIECPPSQIPLRPPLPNIKRRRGKGDRKGFYSDDNDNDNENDNNNLTSAAVLSVSDKSRFACTVIRALSVVTNGIHMTTIQAFLTFVDIYG